MEIEITMARFGLAAAVFVFLLGHIFFNETRSFKTIGLMVVAITAAIGSPVLKYVIIPQVMAHGADRTDLLEQNEVLAMLAEQHPEFEGRVEIVSTALDDGTIDGAEAVERLALILNDYLPGYFARSSNPALQAYENELEALLRTSMSQDPSHCKAYLQGETVIPWKLTGRTVEYLRNFSDSQVMMVAQVIRHAVATPHTPPGDEWMSAALAKLFGRPTSVEEYVRILRQMDCGEFLEFLDFADERLGGEDYFELARGIFADFHSRTHPDI